MDGHQSSASGPGACDSGPQEGAVWTFETHRGDPKTRRRSKSLKTFGLTPSTSGAFGHCRVSAISLLGSVPPPLP